MISRTWTIAANTLLEAIRQKFFNSLLILSIALVGSAHFFQQFDFGAGELKFITDFGFGALFFFGSILAITATTQLFFNELENRTALTMLAKPVYKLEFLVGKFFGAQLLMLIFTLVLSVVLAGILWWRESALVARLGPELADPNLIRYGDIFVFGLLQWVKFGIVCAISLFIGSFSNTNLYTIIVSFFVLIICQLQYIARDAYADMENGLLSWVVRLLALLFPNFQLFNVGDQMVIASYEVLPIDTSLRMLGYGLIYTVAFLLLALLNFRKREI
ncbi:MAG: ABC transporter permease [Coraliomargarita sp.]